MSATVSLIELHNEYSDRLNLIVRDVIVTETVQAILYIDDTGISGSCCPQVFLCDDDNSYVVKFHHNNVGKRVLPNEYISYCLAHSLELPVYEAKLIEVDPFLIEDTKAAWLHGGTQFGIKFDVNALELKKSLISKIENTYDVAKILVFDQWVRNLDRSNEYHNWLCSPVPDTGKYVLKAIDHSDVFHGRDWEISDLHTHTTSFETYNKRQVAYSELGKLIISGEEIVTAVDKINDIQEDQIRHIIDSVPSYWNFSDVDKQNVIQYLLSRRQLILSHMKRQLFVIPKVG